jgi:hypothetical protein
MGGGELGPSSSVPIFSTEANPTEQAKTHHTFKFDVLLFFFPALSGPNVCFSLFAKLPPLVGGATNVVCRQRHPQP